VRKVSVSSRSWFIGFLTGAVLVLAGVALLVWSATAGLIPGAGAGGTVPTEAVGIPAEDARYVDASLRHTGDFFESLDEAVGVLGTRPLLPDPSVLGDPTEIRLVRDAEGRPAGLHLAYPGDIDVYALVGAFDFDVFSAAAAFDKERYTEDAARPRETEVRSTAGIGADPGVAVSADGRRLAVPGMIRWHEGGVEYRIYADRMKLARLRSVADTFR
jgi:hypothetical protein